MTQKQRLNEYLSAGGIFALAIAVSPLAIMLITRREVLSFRVGVPSTISSAFFLLIGFALATRGRIRLLFFYAILVTTPLALLACLEMAAISLSLADRVAPLQDYSTLLHLDKWPVHFHTRARWLPQSEPPRYRPWKSETITINGLGLRTAAPTPKAPGEWRIAVTGGSTVFGWGVFDADTIPARLMDALHLRGQNNFSVYNFGIDSAGIDQERALLEQFAKVYEIDQVIFYTGGNDATRTYLAELGGPSSFSDAYSFELLKVMSRLKARLAVPSAQALAYMDDVVLPRIRQSAPLVPGIRKAQAFCRSTHLRCDFVLQPLLTRKGPIGPEVDLAQSISTLYPRIDVAISQMYADAMTVEEPRRMHNFSSALDGETQPLFVDLIHLNEAGNRLMADRIVSAIAFGPE
jgi:lysophospholipase L1-like esterase